MARNTDRYTILEDEPTPRIPICMLLDKSYSMRVMSGGKPTGETVERDGKIWRVVSGEGETRVDTLVSGVSEFAREILQDHRTRSAVELAIIAFGDGLEICRDFGPVDDSLLTFNLLAQDNQTQLGAAVKVALQLLDRRKVEYQDHSITYYQPQLIIMTDGLATDINHCEISSQEVQQRIRNRKLVTLPFMIGDDQEGVSTLKKFAFENNIFRVDSANLVQLLKFLSQSQVKTSQTTAGLDEEQVYRDIFETLRTQSKFVDQIV